MGRIRNKTRYMEYFNLDNEAEFQDHLRMRGLNRQISPIRSTSMQRRRREKRSRSEDDKAVRKNQRSGKGTRERRSRSWSPRSSSRRKPPSVRSVTPPRLRGESRSEAESREYVNADKSKTNRELYKNFEDIRLVDEKLLPLSNEMREDLIRIDAELSEFMRITRVRYFYITRLINSSGKIVDKDVIRALMELDFWWEDTFSMFEKKTEKARAKEEK